MKNSDKEQIQGVAAEHGMGEENYHEIKGLELAQTQKLARPRI